jgi:hypothetical protein
MPMKSVKARQDFALFDLPANERFKDFGASRAHKLSLNTVVGIGPSQSFTPALHLGGADLWFHL